MFDDFGNWVEPLNDGEQSPEDIKRGLEQLWLNLAIFTKMFRQLPQEDFTAVDIQFMVTPGMKRARLIGTEKVGKEFKNVDFTIPINQKELLQDGFGEYFTFCYGFGESNGVTAVVYWMDFLHPVYKNKKGWKQPDLEFTLSKN